MGSELPALTVPSTRSCDLLADEAHFSYAGFLCGFCSVSPASHPPRCLQQWRATALWYRDSSPYPEFNFVPQTQYCILFLLFDTEAHHGGDTDTFMIVRSQNFLTKSLRRPVGFLCSLSRTQGEIPTRYSQEGKTTKTSVESFRKSGNFGKSLKQLSINMKHFTKH